MLARRQRLQAAEQGDAEGQTALGMMFAPGRGVEPNLVQANKWISIARALVALIFALV